ncbi:MAG: 2-octaprenyl-6-methoxyphenyl hydroxylase, partial [Mesorhizobium sp.]
MVDRKEDAKNRTALDILVAGAGYVGLAAAVSLKQARPSLEVAV